MMVRSNKPSKRHVRSRTRPKRWRTCNFGTLTGTPHAARRSSILGSPDSASSRIELFSSTPELMTNFAVHSGPIRRCTGTNRYFPTHTYHIFRFSRIGMAPSIVQESLDNETMITTNGARHPLKSSGSLYCFAILKLQLSLEPNSFPESNSPKSSRRQIWTT
jgi:hypothetical protein